MAHGLSPFEIEKKGTHRNKEKEWQKNVFYLAEKSSLFGRKTFCG
jgi:hypothetical protein